MKLQTPSLDSVFKRLLSRTARKPDTAPQYDVVLQNDSLNSYEWACYVLQMALDVSPQAASRLAMDAHSYGEATVFTGSLEQSQGVLQTLAKAGGDPMRSDVGAQALLFGIKASVRH